MSPRPLIRDAAGRPLVRELGFNGDLVPATEPQHDATSGTWLKGNGADVWRGSKGGHMWMEPEGDEVGP